MSAIAGLQDFRQVGPPADIGTFQLPCSIMVFQHTFSGTTYTCAIRSGDQGWILVDYLPTTAANNSTVINAAITYVRDLGGGVVYLARGTYSLGRTATIPIDYCIMIYDNVWLIGEGEETVLTMPNNTDATIITNQYVMSDPVPYNTDFGIMHLKILGNGANQGDAVGWPNYSGIAFQTCQRFVLAYLHIEETRAFGVVLGATLTRRCVDGFVLNVIVRDTYSATLGMACFDGQLENVVYVDCIASEAQANGFVCWGYHIAYIRCKSFSNGTGGFYVDSDVDNQTFDVTYMDCLSHDNTTSGFAATDYCYSVHYVAGCSQDNGQQGFTIEGHQIFVSDMTIRDNGPDSEPSYGIYIVNATAKDVFIHHCDIYATSASNQVRGIYVNNGPSEVTISHCHIYNHDWDGIKFYDAVTWCDVIHCTIDGNTRNIRLDNNVDDTYIFGNKIFNGTIGIDILSADCERTRVFKNRFSGNATNLNDGGTDTILPEFYVPFAAPNTNIGTHPAGEMTQASDTTLRFSFMIPSEFQELVRANIHLVSAVAGNMRRTITTNWGKRCSTEDYNAGSGAIAAGVQAVLANDMVCLPIKDALDGITAKDLIGLEFLRDATHGDDTVAGSIYVLGLSIEYV